MSNWSKNLDNSHSHLNFKRIAIRNSHSHSHSRINSIFLYLCKRCKRTKIKNKFLNFLKGSFYPLLLFIESYRYDIVKKQKNSLFIIIFFIFKDLNKNRQNWYRIDCEWGANCSFYEKCNSHSNLSFFLRVNCNYTIPIPIRQLQFQASTH